MVKFFNEKKIERPKNPFRKGSFEGKDEKDLLLKMLEKFFWTKQEKNQKRTELFKKIDQFSIEKSVSFLKTKLIFSTYKNGGLESLIELKEIFSS